MSMHAVPSRPWLAHYPANVPAEIDVDGLPTLDALIRNSMQRFADRPAFVSFGKTLTYSQIGSAAEAVAGWLQAQGFKKGDRVAIMMPNVMAYPAAMFGVLLAGLTVVNVNPLYTTRELTISSTIPVLRRSSYSRISRMLLPRRCPTPPSRKSLLFRLAICSASRARSFPSSPNTSRRSYRPIRCRRRCGSSRLSARAAARAIVRSRHRSMMWRSAVYWRHDRRFEGRDAHASQCFRQCGAG